ncbi:hypothetical protein [Haladaptatus sp. DYF46]|uniref:hypothetical protein n=1 Tax=Haladaptatus sp. DYF46 TaxID=2886041 RepID=UPI001E4CECA5|nr:hypothetical protein [Haladaptatus sp. DYF46]
MVDFGRYNASNVKKLLQNPRMAVGECRKLGIEVNTKIHQKAGGDVGVDVMNEDWDTLVILDGTRYDTFAENNVLDGKLEFRRSRGSQSSEFIQGNFSGEELHDTVYVTANPYVTELEDGVFHSVINLLTEWDDDLQTVLPETVIDAALDAYEQYPNKRFIVHFMQPHYPFIGEKGRSMNHRGFAPNDDSNLRGDRSIWNELQYDISEDTPAEVKAAYEENLRLVFPHVQKLIDEIPGKTVVSADHGNLLGDRLSPIPVRAYGHPRGLRAPELVKVPWFVVEGETRRDVTSDPPEEEDESSLDEDMVEDRLQALGYK